MSLRTRLIALMAVVASVLGVLTVNNMASAKQPAPSTHPLRWSGEQVFDAVYFDRGPAASSLPRKYFPPAQTSSASDLASLHRLAAQLDAKYPGTLDTLRAGLASGSPVRASSALQTTGQRLTTIVHKVDGAQHLIRPNCAAFLIVAAFGFAVWAYEATYVEAVFSGVQPDKVTSLETDRYVTAVMAGLSA